MITAIIILGCILFGFVFVKLFILSRYTSGGDFKNPVLYIGDKRDIEGNVFLPIKDNKCELYITDDRVKIFLAFVKDTLKNFENKYSSKNKFKLQFSDFTIKYYYKIFGRCISEYYVDCTLLNKLYKFCVKYGCINIFNNVLEQFVIIFGYKKLNLRQVSLNLSDIQRFESHPNDIVFYIIVNWID